MCMWDFRDMAKHGQGEGDTTAVTAVATVTPVYSVHSRGMWSQRVMSSARVIGRGMPQWALWKLLRKPEGSIWTGPLGNLPSHFTSRDKEKQRCNVPGEGGDRGTNCDRVRQFVRTGAIFRRSRE